MAVVASLPTDGVIRAFKGVLDFVAWRGIFYVRSWPRPPSSPRSAPVQAAGAAFASFSRRLASVDSYVLTQAKAATQGTDWTWKDLLTSAAYGNLSRW